MSEQPEHGEVRVTVQEFADIAKSCRQILMNDWSKVGRSPSPKPKFQEVEHILFELVSPSTRFWAEKSFFWEEQIPKVKNGLKAVSEKDLMPIFLDAPAFHVWNLIHQSPNKLLEYLQSLRREIVEGTHKLSQLQIEILLNLYLHTIGAIASAKWVPREWLESRTTVSPSSVSQSLKRLSDRLLINCVSKKKGTPKRTTHVQFTHLGFLVAKRIWSGQGDDVRQKFVDHCLRNNKL